MNNNVWMLPWLTLICWNLYNIAGYLKTISEKHRP